MKMDIERRKQTLERIVKLYEDWLSTKKTQEVKEVRQLLREAKKAGQPGRFAEVSRRMGQDGQTLMDIFSKSWSLFSQTPSRAKIKIAEELYRKTPNSKKINEAATVDVKKDGSVVDEFGHKQLGGGGSVSTFPLHTLITASIFKHSPVYLFR